MKNKSVSIGQCSTFGLYYNLTISQESDITANRVSAWLFNLSHGATTHSLYDLDYIAKFNVKVKWDLEALQEVDLKTDRINKLDIATQLSFRTKMIPIFAKAMNDSQNEYGFELWSKFLCYETSNLPLRSRPDNEPHILFSACGMSPCEDRIRFMGTHLDHPNNSEGRMGQVKGINALLNGEDIPSDHCGYLVKLEWTPKASKPQIQ